MSDADKAVAEPPLALKIACAILGLVVLVAMYALYRSSGAEQRVAAIALFALAPIVGGVLWLILRSRADL